MVPTGTYENPTVMTDPAFDVTLNTQDLTKELSDIEKIVAERELDDWTMFEGYFSGQRYVQDSDREVCRLCNTDWYACSRHHNHKFRILRSGYRWTL